MQPYPVGCSSGEMMLLVAMLLGASYVRRRKAAAIQAACNHSVQVGSGGAGRMSAVVCCGGRQAGLENGLGGCRAAPATNCAGRRGTRLCPDSRKRPINRQAGR